MSSLEDLKTKAKQLLSLGHSPGQIADELSLSVETVTWLLTQDAGSEIPKDVHIDWTSVSANGELLEDLALILSKRHYLTFAADPAMADASYDVMVGVSISGIPLATLLAAREGVDLAIYHPSKQSTSDRPIGSISGSFSQIKGSRSIIVDDVITSGNTMTEVVEYLRKNGSNPIAIWVIFDKRGLREVDGVPVMSLFKISRID